MNTTTYITLYVGNRLDQAREVVPREIADEFSQAVLTGFFAEPPGGGGEWAYRLWLTSKDGLNASWDEADEDALFEGLRDALDNVGRHKRGLVTRAIWGAS
jgi:hypothetical protein